MTDASERSDKTPSPPEEAAEEKSEKIKETEREETVAVRNKYNKNILFSLVLKNDKEVRTLDELRRHFDIEDIVERCIDDNRLADWLENRCYERERRRVNELKAEYDRRQKNNQASGESERENLQWLAGELCDVFGVAEEKDKIDKLDDKRLKASRIKESELKGVISEDDSYLIKFKQRMARNQGELQTITDEIKKKGRRGAVIYLVSQANKLPYTIEAVDIKKGIRYVGVRTIRQDGSIIGVKIKDGEAELNRNETEKLLKMYSGSFVNVRIFPADAVDDYIDVPNRKRTRKNASGGFATVTEKLVHYVDAGLPLIYLNTFEEDKADELVDAVRGDKKVYEWCSEGFFVKTSRDGSGGFWKSGWSLLHTLKFLIEDYLMRQASAIAAPGGSDASKYDLRRSILILKDAHNALNEDEIIAKLKYLAQLIFNGQIEGCNIVIVSPVLNVPSELENYVTIVKLAALTDSEIADTLDKFCAGQNVAKPGEALRQKLIRALRGMSEFDILNILSLAILDDRELKSSDTELILEQKKQLIEKAAILELVDVRENEDDIGGLEELKKWLRHKKKIFVDIDRAETFGVNVPKGVMIAGMPGCGKSLTAKATSAIFDMPLLKMDMGRIMGKYVGESEKNMRRALQLSETIAPCVLWIDEIEKAFAGTGGDGGSDVTMRLLGTFLTWLQEKKSTVFVVATANDAMRLPPELLRRGRFDEVFYVGLPNAAERRAIFRIHIERRRGNDWQNIEPDIDGLVKRTANYSGADIEGIVREAVETAFYNDEPCLTTARLNKTIDKMPSMSKPGSSARRQLQSYVQNNFRAASQKDKAEDERVKKWRGKMKETLLYRWDRLTHGRIYRQEKKCGEMQKLLANVFPAAKDEEL